MRAAIACPSGPTASAQLALATLLSAKQNPNPIKTETQRQESKKGGDASRGTSQPR
jgi:hypothetical protein